jgi:hypothetical protein
MPTILATQKAEIRTVVQSQSRQIVHETLSQRNPSQKRAGGVSQGEGSEFKPQYYKQTNKQNKIIFTSQVIGIAGVCHHTKALLLR